MVNKELLDKLKSLYQRKFNISLTDEETTKMATDLLNLMKVIIKPLPKKPNNETCFEGEK